MRSAPSWTTRHSRTWSWGRLSGVREAVMTLRGRTQSGERRHPRRLTSPTLAFGVMPRPSPTPSHTASRRHASPSLPNHRHGMCPRRLDHLHSSAQPGATGAPPTSPDAPHGPPGVPCPVPPFDQPPRPPADTRRVAARPPQGQPPSPAHAAAVHPTALPLGHIPSLLLFLHPADPRAYAFACTARQPKPLRWTLHCEPAMAWLPPLPPSSELPPSIITHFIILLSIRPPSSSHRSTGTNQTADGAASSPQPQTSPSEGQMWREAPPKAPEDLRSNSQVLNNFFDF